MTEDILVLVTRTGLVWRVTLRGRVFGNNRVLGMGRTRRKALREAETVLRLPSQAHHLAVEFEATP